MVNKISTVFQFKKGNAARWREANPILLAGEPGFVLDESRLKIGDGISKWNDLPYVGEESVVNALTHYDFPSIGKVNTIYKAEQEKKIYQWNSQMLKYEIIGDTEADDVLAEIGFIHGGGATLE